MTTVMILLAAMISSAVRTPLLDLYQQAETLIEDGSYEESVAVFNEIFDRMPDNPRALYNHAVSFLATGDLHSADSLLTTFPDGVFLEDTLLEARSSAKLGNAMANEDYAGVQGVVEMLLPAVSGGDSSERIRQNYEVALKWLSQNEPPPQDNQNQSNDNSDQNEDQQDENQDENQSDDNQDQQDNNDNQDENQDDDQSDDNGNQPDNNDSQDENQNDDQSEDRADQPDNNDNQDQSGSENEDEDQQDEDQNESQPPPPGQPEMTPDVAQMILDMVEEAQADTTDGTVGGAIGVPSW